MRRAIVATMLLALFAFAPLAADPSPAHAATEIVSATIENGYPRTLTFKVTARADANITDVSLQYAIRGRGTSAIGKPAEFAPAPTLSAEVVLQLNSSANYIPVGSEFTYSWLITTADGATFTGPEQKYLFLPTGKEWKTAQNEIMKVFYHGERENLANAYLKSGTDTYEAIGKTLLKTSLTVLPVHVIMFADSAEMDLARPGTGGRIDAVTVCGTQVTTDIVLVIPQSCGTPDRTDTLRHELTHILTKAAGEGPLGRVPLWLDEGTAVYSQSVPGTDFTGPFQAAARANRLIPFNQMGTAATSANQVGLYYGQSYMMAKYLIDKAGPEKFAEFFATNKRGGRFDDVLKASYGFDMAGFEAEFRTAVGLQAGPTAAPTRRPQQTGPTAAPTQRQATPTRTPANAAAQVSNDDDDSIDPLVLGAIGAAVLFALVAVFFYLISMMLQQRRVSAAKSAAPGAPAGLVHVPGATPAAGAVDQEPPPALWAPPPPPPAPRPAEAPLAPAEPPAATAVEAPVAPAVPAPPSPEDDGFSRWRPPEE